MQHTKENWVIGGVFMLTAALAGAPAHAGSEVRTVRYSALDLTEGADVRTLYRRIQNAARELCDHNPASARSDESQACVDHAVSRAVAEIIARELNRRYRDRPS